jgi:hypothetical protein
MLKDIPAPILAAYIEGLRKMLDDDDEQGVIAAVEALDDLECIPPELQAGYIKGVASIGQH